MPMPTEHSCRLLEPRDGAPTRRANGEREHEGKKYDVIYQQQEDKKWAEQAYRYPKETWKAPEARVHCKSHDGILFEPASGDEKPESKESGGLQTRASLAGRRFRIYSYLPRSGALRAKVQREQRVIEGCAVITAGEALGHSMWIDSEFLDQIAAAGNASAKGVKSRFTHPGLCSDGLGKYLGRYRNFRREDGVVRADLHLSEAARASPEAANDPTEYLLKLSEEDPQAFGNSIVFYHDVDAEDAFVAEHEDDDGKFISPDPANVNHHFHCRLAKLAACDVVDEPAANDGGFFSESGDETAARAEQFLLWAFGLTHETPSREIIGGASPERIREFLDVFLARHRLEVVAVPIVEELEMTEADLKTKEDQAAQKAKDETLARLKALKEAFPGDEAFAVGAFERGLDPTAARAEYADSLAAALKTKDEEIKSLKADVAKIQAENEGIRKQLLTGAAPVSHGVEPQPQSFAQMVAAYQTERKCSYEQAVRICALEHPEAYAAAESATS